MKSAFNFVITSLVISILLIFSHTSNAEIKGDVNGDHKIDLKEAIYALQVVSGIIDGPLIDKEEVEPNNNKDKAVPVFTDSIISANIGSNDEEDWYKITIKSNGLIQVGLQNLNIEGTEKGNIQKAIFYHLDGLDLIELNTITISHGAYGYFIAPEELATSPYTVVSANEDYYINVIESPDNIAPYELKFSFTPLITSDYGEENNESETSYKIQENDEVTALIGYINDEEDWYKIIPSANGLLQYSIENLHPSGSAIDQGIIDIARLYQQVGLDLIELSQLSTSHGAYGSYIGPGDLPISAYTSVSVGGIYYIKIPKSRNNAAPYELKTIFAQSEITDKGESNNSSETAFDILENDTITALIGYEDDEEDWYKIVPSANGSFQIELENLLESTSGIDQGIIGTAYLYKKDGLDLTEVTAITVSHGVYGYYIGPGDYAKSNTIAVSAGSIYYIKVPAYIYNSASYNLKTKFLAD